MVHHDGIDPRGADPTSAWASRGASAEPSAPLDSAFDSGLSERRGATSHLARWMGWRLRLLVACALLGCVAVFALINHLAMAPHIAAVWRADAQDRLELARTTDPALQPYVGQTLVGVKGAGGPWVAVDALALERSARWITSDARRARYQNLRAQLAAALAQPHATLRLGDGTVLEVQPQPRGLANLPPTFWLLAALGLALYLMAAIVLLSHPSTRNLIYAVMAGCQGLNLGLIAAGSALDLGLGMPAPLAILDLRLRMALDLITAAAIVNAACLHPRRLPGSGWIALAGWAVAGGLIAMSGAGQLSHLWWWTQGGVGVLGLIAIGLLSWSYQIEVHPFALVLRRLGIVTVSTWVLLTLALAASGGVPAVQHQIIDLGSTIWYVFLGALLLLVPFLARSQHFMREFALLAAVSTVATSLDLLFVAVFSLGQFASLALSLFVSLAVYTGVRQWIIDQLRGSSMLTTERMFEQLYRIAREVEIAPERAPALLSQVLAQLFDPLEVTVVERRAAMTRVAGDGSSLLVPAPALALGGGTSGEAVRLRFAQRGRRLFTLEDARLTDRIVEQIERAARFDRAVEQGRSEERLRLAQDLHDDIGARLLTLMYKATSPEMEDYIRHTLKDLKTLTRGLAESNHRLSHAAAEWKTGLAQRLSAAQVELKWSFVFDEDILLTVVPWSALTRVLRELVSNAIAHAQAQQLEIDFSLDKGRIELTVTDDGIGREPGKWLHGLGLGGVRKRVKQLGGTVEWGEVAPHGIICRIVIHNVSARW
ncbi:MAG: ATP-binding protein [Burkholderiaceae bacterium]